MVPTLVLITMDSDQAAAAARQHDNAVEYEKVRAPYAAPVLEHLGRWSALTLQQTVPVGMFNSLQL